MDQSLPNHEIVLLGAGHTHLHVMRQWRMQPIDGVRLTCVSNQSEATYSGMLPGTLAGYYAPSQMQIDLVQFCAAVGARLIFDDVTGLDVAGSRLLFENRPPFSFDLLSIGIGSVPQRAGVVFENTEPVSIKPMQTFLDRFDARVVTALGSHAERPLRIAVVGGGAGGIEIALALPGRLRREFGNVEFELTLVDAAAEIGGGLSSGVIRHAKRALAAHRVEIRSGRRVVHVDDRGLLFKDGTRSDADVVLWATDAAPAPLLAAFDLPKDEAGFLRTRETLQTVGADAIFAVGDTATIDGSAVPKAGVYAVRQGAVLWENLCRSVRRRPLAIFRPQRRFLKLLSTGDGRAILGYGRLAMRGRWCWRWKDHIDRRFMKKHELIPAPMARAAVKPFPEMRCAGCGSKVGSSVLHAALKRLEIDAAPHVLIGLGVPEDAAVIEVPPRTPLCVTTDFFTAPLDDPFLVGRVAALNALSDLCAVGARPHTALAMAALPIGPQHRQEALLTDLLAGSLLEFRRHDVSLVGGHTIESAELMIGFSLLGALLGEAPRRKANLQAGDRLILTKRLGTGILLAAHRRALCRAAWMESLLASMLRSNRPATDVVQEFDIAAVTDVTGFGLAGHLLEMLDATDLAATISLGGIGLLPGAAELIDHGIQSTMAPANRTVESQIDLNPNDKYMPQYAVLFDPQTSGGLLMGVANDRVTSVLARLHEVGDVDATVVGEVRPLRAGEARIVVH